MKRHMILFLALGIVCSPLLRAEQPRLPEKYKNLVNEEAFEASKEKSEAPLKKILKKTAEYCLRLERAAFDYVCLEEISEKIDHSREFTYRTMPLRGSRYSDLKKTEKHTYIYDYQLIRKGAQTTERRILLEEDGRKKNIKNAQLKTLIFRYEKVLFGPIDLLSTYWQKYHDYQIIGRENLNGVRTIVIRAVPKASLKRRYLSGIIWLRESDTSIVKIEFNQKSIRNFVIIEKIAERYKAEPRITLVSEYNIEKNNIRFPSGYSIEEAYISKKGKKFIRSETNVAYKNYKFFTVETEITF